MPLGAHRRLLVIVKLSCNRTKITIFVLDLLGRLLAAWALGAKTEDSFKLLK